MAGTPRGVQLFRIMEQGLLVPDVSAEKINYKFIMHERSHNFRFAVNTGQSNIFKIEDITEIPPMSESEKE